jgi:hypothetical protein
MKAFVSGDELVGEGQAGHQASLLQPEDCTKAVQQFTEQCQSQVVLQAIGWIVVTTVIAHT